MKIAIVVHGRFWAFDLARALIQRGNDVTILTDYPKWAVRRFGIDPGHVLSCWPHGVLSRLAQPISARLRLDSARWLHPWFERWALAQLKRNQWDAVHVLSGVAEKILRGLKASGVPSLLARGSSHIRVQDEILRSEEQRAGVPIDRPAPWMMAREEREYRLADRIVVLSTFAYDSFVSQGVEPARLRALLLGANLAAFRPAPETAEARSNRILSGAPLRVLYTGHISMRKGFRDLVAVAGAMDRNRFHIRCIGKVTSEAGPLAAKAASFIEFTPHQPESELPKFYATADLFLFPTLEDGFPAVLAHANANGLPIVTTPNCCGPDLIQEGKTGWIVPIRDPRAIMDRLHWCDTHRKELAEMARYTASDFRPREWNDVAADFESLCAEAIGEKDRAVAGGWDGV